MLFSAPAILMFLSHHDLRTGVRFPKVVEISLIPTPSRQTVGCTHLAVQCVHDVKGLERETDHEPTSGFKNAWIYASSPYTCRDVVHNFTVRHSRGIMIDLLAKRWTRLGAGRHPAGWGW